MRSIAGETDALHLRGSRRAPSDRRRRTARQPSQRPATGRHGGQTDRERTHARVHGWKKRDHRKRTGQDGAPIESRPCQIICAYLTCADSIASDSDSETRDRQSTRPQGRGQPDGGGRPSGEAEEQGTGLRSRAAAQPSHRGQRGDRGAACAIP